MMLILSLILIMQACRQLKESRRSRSGLRGNWSKWIFSTCLVSHNGLYGGRCTPSLRGGKRS